MRRNGDNRSVQTKIEQSFARFRELQSEDIAPACDAVLLRLRAEPEDVTEDVPFEPAQTSGTRLRPAFAFASIAIAAMFAAFLLMPGREPIARVGAAGGGVYRVNKGEALRMGERIEANEAVIANGGAGTVLKLTDGSAIEMRAKSELFLEPAEDGVRIRLNEGSVIVNAAKQRRGHLYVQTKDVIVSVVGTVFLVNAEEQGSRVAVIEGEVRVQKGSAEQKLRRGEQVATGPMEPQPIFQEISWSQNASIHVAQLLQPGNASPASPTGTVTGMVRTSSGAPALGARVTAMPADSGDGVFRAASRMAVTDATGHYRLDDVLPGTYTVAAGYNGTRDISKRTVVSVSSGTAISSVDFVLGESRLKFEEVSIRPSAAVAMTGGRGNSNTVGVVKGCTNPPRVDPQQFVAINTTLYNLIAISSGYGCPYVTSLELVSGGPGWIKSDLFDVRALLPQGSPRYALASPELQVMLRTLLEDRFKLSIRRETKERSVYELRLGNTAPKLRPWKEGDKVELDGQPLLTLGQPSSSYLGIQWVPDAVAGESFKLVGRNVSTEELSHWIALAINRPVVDRTGLTGRFHFDVEYSKDGVARPLLPAAIRDQLGLRLGDAKGSYEVFVIDHVEWPSEN